MAQTINLRELLDVAVEAAIAGGRRTLAYFNTGTAVEFKKDDTPVTMADKESEQIILARIRRTYPDHSILAEETGKSEGIAEYRWIIDPLDGTKSFIHGVPLYGTLIGVEVMGRPEVGVIYLPATDELICAATGLGCWWNGRPARVSNVTSLRDALVLTTSTTSCMTRSDAFERLASMTKLVRGWGDCYGYALVATGRADIMLDPRMNPWDCAPLPPILQEAGGRFTDWQGNATIYGSDGFAAPAALHEQVLRVLKAEKRKG